ncbi:MAG: hypothetical protein ACM3SV_14000 [Betaproteobacteria bacterium]
MTSRLFFSVMLIVCGLSFAFMNPNPAPSAPISALQILFWGSLGVCLVFLIAWIHRNLRRTRSGLSDGYDAGGSWFDGGGWSGGGDYGGGDGGAGGDGCGGD